MLIVISIVVIFSAMVFGNYGKGKNSMAIERAGQKLAQDLRRTQEMAMSGTSGTYNGYGIYFTELSGSETKYIIYANNSSSVYTYNTSAPADTLLETINIEAGVKICNIQDNGTDVTNNYISVCFSPPEPVTRIEGNNSGHDLSIILCNIDDNSKTRTIKINNVGRIEVNNP